MKKTFSFFFLSTQHCRFIFFLMFPQANGFTDVNLTLQDPACKATVNATHYTLETPLTGCQTTVYPMQGSPVALYINSVSTRPQLHCRKQINCAPLALKTAVSLYVTSKGQFHMILVPTQAP